MTKAQQDEDELVPDVRERWALHTAIAWRLSLNEEWTAKARAGQFRPGKLWRAHFRAANEETTAWSELHQLMSVDIPLSSTPGSGNDFQRVRIPVTGIREGGTGIEEIILPEVLANLDLAFCEATEEDYLETRLGEEAQASALVAYRQVSVPANAVRYNLPYGVCKPLLSATSNCPPARAPREEAYVPLSEAAHWIATRGNTFDFFVADKAVWAEAISELINAIISCRVQLIGRSRGSSRATKIPGHTIYGFEFSIPWQATPLDLILAERPYLHFRGFTGTDVNWQLGTTDEIWFERERTPAFSHLAVRGEDIASIWPFASAHTVPANASASDQSSSGQADANTVARGATILRTGMAGRPTAKPLILAEMRRRAEAGELLPSLRQEAAALSEWAATSEIGANPTPKTIRNSLLEEYNALKELARKAE